MSASPILIVEDNSATRKMMRLALKAEGYAILEAADGRAALRIVSELEPALVLLDRMLPDMDGFEIAQKMLVLVPNLPIVAVTGWAHADEARALTAGFIDVLLKPVEPSRLVEMAERYVGHSLPPSSPNGKVVLLADDDAMQRKLGQIALAHAGFEVVLAEDGEMAMRLAVERRPDIIVSDVLMPHMDGFAVCKAIRAHPTLARTPIVLMSAHYLEGEDRKLAARFGANRYVSRTAGFSVVVRAVVEAVETPGDEVIAPPSAELQADYLRRITHQLERQASLGAGLARQVSLQATALSILDSLSDSLSRTLDPESALKDTLAECLDAAGLSVGAVLLSGENAKLALKANVGAATTLAWAAHAEVLEHGMAHGGLLIPSTVVPDGQRLLSALGVASALIVPIAARGAPFGVLLLASNRTDLADVESQAFVRVARSIAMQLGEALALTRMVAKLTAAEKRQRMLMEGANDCIFVLDREGRITDANPATEQFFGRARATLVGALLSDFVDPTDPLATGTRRFLRPDGSVVIGDISTSTVETEGTTLEFAIMRDVSEKVRVAEALRVSEVERGRAERALHARDEQLRQSQKMEAIGRLAGGVAHDFNNVLSVILSYGELLLADMKPDDPIRTDVEEIRKAGTRAADLTRQLLMFSRQQVLEPKVVDLNELLHNIHNMLKRILGADVDFVTLPSMSLGRVRVDPSSMDQLIMNLIVNARDAMPTGGKLTMETGNVVLDDAYAREHLGVTPGPHVMLAVTDTGTGIDKQTMARMFEPFFTTKPIGKGTGLGLSTVLGIVQQSGGSIWVYSEIGKGTTFKAYFPRVDALVDPVRTIPVVAMRGSETILLVEDDAQVRLVAEGILRRNGYQVLAAGDAGEAILLSEKHSGTIHLLLSDVVMPQMSGPELAKRLAPSRPAMKVLCMSGYTDDSIIRHGVLDAQMAYIQKPITPHALTTRVREVLEQSS